MIALYKYKVEPRIYLSKRYNGTYLVATNISNNYPFKGITMWHNNVMIRFMLGK